MKSNPMKQALRNGKTMFGMYINVPSPIMVELAGFAGLDFIRIDCSHSSVDLTTTENMIRAAEVVLFPLSELKISHQNCLRCWKWVLWEL